MKLCSNCGMPGTEEHHVYGASNRKISEKYNFKTDLCPICHRSQPQGVHGGNKELDLKLKREFQAKYEETHTREEFISLIGRNYIED